MTGSRILLSVALAACLPAPAVADEDDFAVFRSLKLEVALEAAQAAVDDCRARGYQVAVSVTDRFGILQVALRDRFAGAHTPDTSYRKAWTAASFRTDTSELATFAEAGEGWALRNITNALPLGGGVRILAGDGDMVGAIGISGAPSGSEDDLCAKAGIEAIADRISF